MWWVEYMCLLIHNGVLRKFNRNIISITGNDKRYTMARILQVKRSEVANNCIAHAHKLMRITWIPLGFPLYSKHILQGSHGSFWPPLISNSIRVVKPVVYMDEAYAPPALIVDLGRGAVVACFVIQNRGDRDDSLQIRALSLLNLWIQVPKVVSVIVCNDVPVNTSPRNPVRDNRNRAAHSMRFFSIKLLYNNICHVRFHSWYWSTVPFRSIRATCVTGGSDSTKCHGGHSHFGGRPKML